jgi:predicted DNA-binding protein
MGDFNKTSNFSIRLESGMREDLEEVSKEMGVSSANIVRQAVREHLRNIIAKKEQATVAHTPKEKLSDLLGILKTPEGNEALKEIIKQALQEESPNGKKE